MNDVVTKLLERAKEAHDGAEAMRLSQAALNAANALAQSLMIEIQKAEANLK